MTAETQTHQHTILNAGVDWLTCSTLSRSSSKKMMSLAENCVVGQKRLGNDVKPWGMSGFDGIKCGQIQVGTRGHETLVRLTGDYAASNWRRFYSIADNCSRIDLQVTVDVGRRASEHVAFHYGQAARARRKSKKFPKVWECRDSDGPATLYFGKRVSDLFARVYDKFSQGGESWPTGAVRYELQCNGRQARLNSARLYRSGSEFPAIRDRCFTYFSNHGLSLMWPDTFVSNYSYGRRRSDLEKRLLWLHNAVRPSVAALVAEGRTAELLSALGLSVLKSGKVVTLKVAKAS